MLAFMDSASTSHPVAVKAAYGMYQTFSVAAGEAESVATELDTLQIQ